MAEIQHLELGEPPDFGGNGSQTILGNVQSLEARQVPQKVRQPGQQILSDPQIAQPRYPAHCLRNGRQAVAPQVKQLQVWEVFDGRRKVRQLVAV